MQQIDLSLILPVHNQETIIKPVTEQIKKALQTLKINQEIILVENGSSDKTLEVLQKLASKYSDIKVIVAPKGYGSAVLAGLKKACGKYVSYMPSDGQLDPNLLSKLYRIILSNKYDLVKIKRTTRENYLRFIRSKIFNLLSRQLFNVPVTDINGSPRIFLRKWLLVLDLGYKDSFIDCEMAVKANFLHWRIKEISTPTLPRLGGKSTVNIKTVIEFIRNLLIFRFSKRLLAWRKNLTEKSTFLKEKNGGINFPPDCNF